MLRFNLTNGTTLEIALQLAEQHVAVTQSWPTGEKQVIRIPLPDIKEIVRQCKLVWRFFV